MCFERKTRVGDEEEESERVERENAMATDAATFRSESDFEKVGQSSAMTEQSLRERKQVWLHSEDGTQQSRNYTLNTSFCTHAKLHVELK